MTPIRDEAVREFQRGPEERIRGIPRGPHEELRISLSEYEGWPYVDLRVWVQYPGVAGWRPTPKGTSIRIREIEDVISALRKVLVLVSYDPAPVPQPKPKPATQLPLPGIKPPWDDDDAPGIGQRRSRKVKT
jgi:hypothetical protein